jgi:hypothetical protein
MTDIIEFYLIGGNVRIGKKELTLELLRKDSILRVLLGFEAGNLGSLQSPINLSDQEGLAILDFNWREKRRLDGDPTPTLNELKARYGKNIGGVLSFYSVYTTFGMTSYSSANLNADTIVLETIA